MTHGLENFAIVGDDLMIASTSVRQLVERAGATPLYVYDRLAITHRVNTLRACLPDDVHLHYAVKANPMPAVVQHLSTLVDGLDVASAQEMLVSLNSGTSPANISFAGPGKSEAEVRRAVAAGITLNIESERELGLARLAGDSLGQVPRVAIRVNPGFELKSAGMAMGGAAKQFGVDAEQVPELLKDIEASEFQFEGFHIFCGSQNLKADAIIEAQRRTIELTLALASQTELSVPTANIGGGFGIPYTTNDRPLDIRQVAEALDESLAPLRQQMPETEVVIELGRYLVGEAGVYICKVIDRKVSRGQLFLITDGGLHHHLAATGNFGQVLRRNYPIVVATRMESQEREVANVVGPLCTPLDMLGSAAELPHADVGDLIAVMQSGAYGLTASPTAFLSHPAPIEMLV